MNALTFSHEGPFKSKYRMNQGDYKQGVQDLQGERFAAGSIEAFARVCILRAIEYEESRLNRKDYGFERYTPDNDQHLLAELDRELRAN